MARILYITFDGITDPLGRSQILPYLIGLSQRGHNIHILSQEKKDQLLVDKESILNTLEKNGITWDYITYKNKPPIIQPLIQRNKIKQIALDIVAKKNIEFTHCRSYMAAWVGLKVKEKTGLPFLFDMRGFWADERKEGGLWPYKNPLYRAVYHHVKRLEKRLLWHANHIVSLTHRGKEIIRGWNLSRDFSISVIPCCADLKHFNPSLYSDEDRQRLRASYGLHQGDVVVGYVGSIGTWYMLDEMLDAFALWQKNVPNLKLFFLSRISLNKLQPKLKSRGIPIESVRVQSTSYDHVPKHIAIFDVGLFFILPAFSKAASSPVKQGEMLSMGLPVVCNAGVGDTDRVIEEIDRSLLVDGFDSRAYENVLHVLQNKTYRESMGPLCQATAKRWFDVQQGIDSYHKIYTKITQ